MGTFRVVRVFDPAVRWSIGARAGHVDPAKYAREHDVTMLADAMRPGVRPQVFVARHLRRSHVLEIDDVDAEPMRREIAFACGISSVEGADGSIARPAGPRWTEDEIERFDVRAIDEIGGVVLARSRCSTKIVGLLRSAAFVSARIGAASLPICGAEPERCSDRQMAARGTLNAATSYAAGKRREIRRAYGCGCASETFGPAPENEQIVGGASATRELVEKVTGHPAREVGCPWASFYEREVSTIRAAYEWWPNVETLLGPDPEWWVLDGLRVYHRALEATRSDVVEIRRSKVEADAARRALAAASGSR